jgi:hypothetical protein
MKVGLQDGSFGLGAKDRVSGSGVEIEAAIGWMRHYGIARILVHSVQVGPEAWRAANVRVLAANRADERLVPCGNLPGYVIPRSGEWGEVRELILEGPFQAFRICDPLGLQFPCTGILPGLESLEILEWLGDRDRTLMIDLPQCETRRECFQQVAQVEELTARCPSLRIGLNGIGYKHLPAYLALVTRRRNLHLGTTFFGLSGLLTGAVASVGAEHLYFASCGPTWEPSVSIGAILHAELNISDQRMIGSGTLESLLLPSSKESHEID